jgi:hypothetical protein
MAGVPPDPLPASVCPEPPVPLAVLPPLPGEAPPVPVAVPPVPLVVPPVPPPDDPPPPHPTNPTTANKPIAKAVVNRPEEMRIMVLLGSPSEGVAPDTYQQSTGFTSR